MRDAKNMLVLHFLGVAEPMLVAVDEQTAETLPPTLPDKLLRGEVETVTAENGAAVVVNFDKVVAAHIEAATPLQHRYGALARPA